MLIDDVLRDFNVTRVDTIVVAAPADEVYKAARELDLIQVIRRPPEPQPRRRLGQRPPSLVTRSSERTSPSMRGTACKSCPPIRLPLQSGVLELHA